jgi:hypothetical protein
MVAGIASRYPFDYEAIEKGDSFPVSEIESITKKEYGTKEYDFAIMTLQATVTRELEAIGKSYTVVIQKGGLTILTDTEATRYNDQRFMSGFKTMVGAHFRQMGVDTTQLEEVDQQHHERRIMKQSHMLMGAKNGRSEARKLIASGNKKPKEIESKQ